MLYYIVPRLRRHRAAVFTGAGRQRDVHAPRGPGLTAIDSLI